MRAGAARHLPARGPAVSGAGPHAYGGRTGAADARRPAGRGHKRRTGADGYCWSSSVRRSPCGPRSRVTGRRGSRADLPASSAPARWQQSSCATASPRAVGAPTLVFDRPAVVAIVGYLAEGPYAGQAASLLAELDRFEDSLVSMRSVSDGAGPGPAACRSGCAACTASGLPSPPLCVSPSRWLIGLWSGFGGREL